MKKFFAMLIVLLMFSAQVEAISYEDSTFAVETINNKLRDWKCAPLKIWYGDSRQEDLDYINSLERGHFTACMVFYSDFHTPPAEDNATTFEPDADYKNWSWYFGLCNDKWEVVTYGY